VLEPGLSVVFCGMDAELSRDGWDRDGLARKLAAVAPRRLAFTSKRAASVWFARGTGDLRYGRAEEPVGAAEIWVLPSTSGLAVRYWDDAPWRALAEAVRGDR
jgi:TDG/mug DNA glycosylase family protein